MARFILTTVFAGLVAFSAYAATQDIVYDNFQTIYTETPVQSYYAYPDDPNFIPETEFMNRADSLDYDLNIEAARQSESMAHPGAKANPWRTRVLCLPIVRWLYAAILVVHA